MVLRVNPGAIQGSCRPDHQPFAGREMFMARTATGEKEPSRLTYTTKSLQTSIRDMKDNKSWARTKECKTQEKHHNLLSVAEKSLAWKC